MSASAASFLQQEFQKLVQQNIKVYEINKINIKLYAFNFRTLVQCLIKSEQSRAI